jgi:hypothetical protein
MNIYQGNCAFQNNINKICLARAQLNAILGRDFLEDKD